MKHKLNKYDIILTITVFVISLIFISFIKIYSTDNKYANVYYQNQLVHTFDLSNKEYQKYEIEATNGLVVIESKDGLVRVVSETSQNNICSIQGWSNSVAIPIVCLPNDLYIKITGDKVDEEVDVFIK